jgi:hypothetical protein
MWRRKPNVRFDMGNATTLWSRAVNCIYTEVLIKSLVEAYPDSGVEYWRYATAVVDRTLTISGSRNIALGKFLHRRESPLLARWLELGIDVPI